MSIFSERINMALNKSKIPNRNTKNIIVVFILFCIVNYCYYAFSSENAAIARNTKDYIEPARLLLLEGKYESKYRLPVYPLFLAVFLLFTSNITNLVIFCQVILLFGCALIAKQITELFIKKKRFDYPCPRRLQSQRHLIRP